MCRYLKFNIANQNADWKACKEAFITEFENSFVTALAAIMEKRKTTEKMEEYAKKRMETCSKMFPSLPQAELNLLVMTGFDTKYIKQLIKQKDSDKETFLILCGALDEMETTPST